MLVERVREEDGEDGCRSCAADKEDHNGDENQDQPSLFWTLKRLSAGRRFSVKNMSLTQFLCCSFFLEIHQLSIMTELSVPGHHAWDAGAGGGGGAADNLVRETLYRVSF